MNKKFLIGIIFAISFFIFILGFNNFLLLIFAVAIIIFIIEERSKKRIITKKKEEKKTIPKDINKKTVIIQPTKPFIPINYSQFEKETKIRVEKKVKKELNGEVIWLIDTQRNIKNRLNFSVIVKINEKTFDGTIYMNNNGPEKLVLPKIKKEISFVKQNTKKKEVKKSVQTNKPKTPAEESGNVIINENGKPEVKPNYEMIALDWINNNLDYLNKACNDAVVKDNGLINALLEKEKLPKEQESWKYIAKNLKEQEEIDHYTIKKDGILITIE